MGAFTFSEQNILQLEVCGKSYKVEPFSKGVLDGIEAYRKRIAEIKDLDSPSHENVLAACACVGELTDAILGEGAYREVFRGREVTFLDHQELAMFLLAEVLAFRKKRLADFTVDGIERAHAVLKPQQVQ